MAALKCQIQYPGDAPPAVVFANKSDLMLKVRTSAPLERVASAGVKDIATTLMEISSARIRGLYVYST